ncbi:hypothetical protein EHS19_04525 [Bifidobacterium jacchi]|uniref:Uncharacterized protein n=1 Tax=Bifidobacterium jacchi TaxID=2490545 RepID=A0A5N5RK09_9BIFI|nr:hypothetical protein EHS19_04525 [Bifidobacterium jacchi]
MVKKTRTERSETTSYRLQENTCSSWRSVRCRISFTDCVGGFAAGTYPGFVVAELGGDSPPPAVQPVMAITAKKAAASTAKSRRERIRLSMVARVTGGVVRSLFMSDPLGRGFWCDGADSVGRADKTRFLYYTRQEAPVDL